MRDRDFNNKRSSSAVDGAVVIKSACSAALGAIDLVQGVAGNLAWFEASRENFRALVSGVESR